jgi:hypothetical protein
VRGHPMTVGVGAAPPRIWRSIARASASPTIQLVPKISGALDRTSSSVFRSGVTRSASATIRSCVTTGSARSSVSRMYVRGTRPTRAVRDQDHPVEPRTDLGQPGHQLVGDLVHGEVGQGGPLGGEAGLAGLQVAGGNGRVHAVARQVDRDARDPAPRHGALGRRPVQRRVPGAVDEDGDRREVMVKRCSLTRRAACSTA